MPTGWIANKNYIGGGYNVTYKEGYAPAVQGAAGTFYAEKPAPAKQEAVAAAPAVAAPAPQSKTVLDAFGSTVPAGVQPLAPTALPGRFAAYADNAYFNYRNDDVSGLTIQEKGDALQYGGIGKTSFVPLADLKAEREKYYAGKADELAFIESHPYGQSLATGGYSGFAAPKEEVSSRPIQLGAGPLSMTPPKNVEKGGFMGPAIPFADINKMLDVYPGKTRIVTTNLPGGGYQQNVTTWSKPEVSYGGPFNTRAEMQRNENDEVKRLQSDRWYFYASLPEQFLRQPGEVIGAASMGTLGPLLAKENLRKQALIEEKGVLGGFSQYTSESVISAKGLPVIAATQAGLGAGIGFIVKGAGGLVAGTTVGKVLSSPVTQLGGGAAWLYTGPKLPILGTTSYKSVKEEAVRQGASEQEAEQAGRSFIGTVAVGLPAAVSGFKWAQEVSPVASGVRTVPFERPETRLEQTYNALMFKKTSGKVVDEMVVQRGIFNENTMKTYWQSGRDYVKISKAYPSLETRYAPPGAYNVEMWRDEAFLSKLGTANNLAADVPQIQKAIANTLPRIRETQGVESAWNEGPAPRTKQLTPGEKYAGDVVAEKAAPFIQQRFGSGAGYGQQAPEFRTGRLAQYPGDEDLQFNFIFSKESGSAIGRIIANILPERGFLSGDSLNIFARKWQAAVGKGTVEGGKVINPETGKSLLEGHAYGDAGVPDNVLGVKMQQPSIKVPGSRIPTSSLSQEAANTGARTLNVYRTPEGKIVMQAPPDKPTSYAQFYKNAVSSAKSAKESGAISSSEFDKRMASMEGWKKWAQETYPESKEGFQAFERGTLKTEMDAIRPTASKVPTSFLSASSGGSLLKAFSGVSTTRTKGTSASSISKYPSSSAFSYYPASPKPSSYASKYPDSSVPSYFGESSGSSSMGSSYNYYYNSSSSSSSSSSSVYNYYNGYSYPRYSFGAFSVPSLGGGGGRGSGGIRAPGGKRGTRYAPSVWGILSGARSLKGQGSFTGLEIRGIDRFFSRKRR